RPMRQTAGRRTGRANTCHPTDTAALLRWNAMSEVTALRRRPTRDLPGKGRYHGLPEQLDRLDRSVDRQVFKREPGDEIIGAATLRLLERLALSRATRRSRSSCLQVLPRCLGAGP